jgi:TolA-binding protein
MEWDSAVEAYEAAMRYEDSRLYDKALYKLAWTYFQKFDYDSAISAFKRLIAFYDARRDSQDETARALSAELRNEAIEYLARSLAEDDWDGDGVADANAGVDRAVGYLEGGAAYEEEILAAYANALVELHDQDKYEEAIDVLRRLIRRNPLDPQNPKLQERIVAIYDVMGRKEDAAAARSEMATLFSPTGAWYAANRHDLSVIARADELVELTIRQEATLHHQAAQELRRRGLEEGRRALLVEAAAEYQTAARAYAEYLAGYPKSKHAYDMRFFYAETLFFSGRFTEAADQYAQVRDAEARTRYREGAAFSAIKSIEQEISLQVSQRKLAARADPSTPADQAAAEVSEEAAIAEGQSDRGVIRVVPEELPSVTARWLAEVDRYLELGLSREDDPERRPKLAFQAAEMLHRFRQFGQSRPRLEALIDDHPTTDVAGFAAALIIDSYRRENDWGNLEKWAKILEERKLGKAEEQERLAADIRAFKLGAQFQKAESLLEDKRYLAAAREFERIVDADTAGTLQFADKALYNAALAYEAVRYYDSAARIFERIVTEPRFAGSEFLESALFALAENHSRFFDFEAASESYLRLVDKNPKNPQSPFALAEAARLLDNDGKLRSAALNYERYANLYPERSDAAAVLYRAAEVYKKMGDRRQADRIYALVRERYAMEPAAGPLVVHATLELADSALAAKNRRQAADLYQQVIAEFNARGMQPGTVEAEWAAKAKFALIELKYEEYANIELRGSLDAMGKQIQRKEALLKELEAAYIDIFPYKALEWTFAGYFRIGKIYEEFASTLYEAPVPAALSDEEQDIYQMELEDVGVRYEDTAVERYITTVEKARELKFRNPWTELALAAVNRYRPADYPLLKDAKAALPFEAWLLTGPGARPGDGVARVPDPEAEPEPPPAEELR